MPLHLTGAQSATIIIMVIVIINMIIAIVIMNMVIAMACRHIPTMKKFHHCENFLCLTKYDDQICHKTLIWEFCQ